MAFNNNASRLYAVREATSGTLLAPSSGQEGLALQPGFDFNPSVDTQQNEELRASIGATKPIQGVQRPSASFSHYLRGSGSPGVKSDFSLLLESLFGSLNDFYSAMTVSALNNKLNFTDDDGTVTATITSGVYETPQLLAAAVTTAMNAANGAKVATCSYSTVTGKFTILSTGTVLSLLWKTGANGSDNTDTHIGTLLGFSDAANNSGTAATTGYAGGTVANSIERVTTTGSSASVVNLSAGGSDFVANQCILGKDGAGYWIRPIESISTNALTLGMSAPTSIGSGVGVGKPISYIPANSGHPTLSLWLYRANGAAIEAEAGCLVTQMQLRVEVGSPLNMSFQAGGVQFFFNPIIISAANKYLDVTDDGGTVSVSVATGAYASPIELAAALQAALNAGSVDVWTVTYNSIGSNAGKFTIASDGTTTSLLLKTGTHGSDNTDTHIGTILGFTDVSDKTGANTYTSASVQSYADSLTPTLDNADPLIAKEMEVLIGDAANYVSMCVQSMNGNIANEVSDVKCIKSVSGIDSKVVKKRTSSFEITAVLEAGDADKFDRFINNRDTKFLFNLGLKSGGNWIEGYCGSFWAPQASISGYRVGDSEGSVVMIFTITPFVSSTGVAEIFYTQL